MEMYELINFSKLYVDRIGLSIVAHQPHFHLYRNMLQLLITLVLLQLKMENFSVQVNE